MIGMAGGVFGAFAPVVVAVVAGLGLRFFDVGFVFFARAAALA